MVVGFGFLPNSLLPFRSVAAHCVDHPRRITYANFWSAE
jgi:hypothetical protein